MRPDAVGGAEAVTALLTAAADSAAAGGATRVRLFRRHKADPSSIAATKFRGTTPRRSLLTLACWQQATCISAAK